MERIVIAERTDRVQKLEEIGLSFHSWDDYWNEGVCYKFSMDEVEVIEEATSQLHQMCLKAVEHVINNRRYAELSIPEPYWDAIADSWARKEVSLYGRFDLAYGPGCSVPKMLEYNADTPTSLLESAVAQWYWMKDVFPQEDQFNSLHERLVDQWKKLPALSGKIHFASLNENEEDWVCVHYLMETALQAGFQVKHVFLEGIGYDENARLFVDTDDEHITTLFKLYPWEWIMREEVGPHTINTATHLIEPTWKSLLSNKAMLAILWELFPDSPYLLPAYLQPGKLASYAKKPIFSREGSNVELYESGQLVASDTGPYGSEGFVYQQSVALPQFDDWYPVIGSWIVGSEPAGMCIREDRLKITTNMSNFIPHYIALR